MIRTMMRVNTAVALTIALASLAACDQLPGKPALRVAPPTLDTAAGFAGFYSENCAGCHGADGTQGPARPMRDAVYLAAVPDDAMFNMLRNGIEGTRMPGFGGNRITAVDDAALTAFVKGMRTAWGNASATAPTNIAWAPQPGKADAEHGRELFDARCVSCHPRTQPVGSSATVSGSVTDPFYLRLVSDQHLRTSIVFGRNDLNSAPANMPSAAGPFQDGNGQRVDGALSSSDVDDLVAYLSGLRSSPLYAPPTSAAQSKDETK